MQKHVKLMCTLAQVAKLREKLRKEVEKNEELEEGSRDAHRTAEGARLAVKEANEQYAGSSIRCIVVWASPRLLAYTYAQGSGLGA